MVKILVLGGTTEASRLARALAERTDIDAMLSLAGRTADPAAQPIPTRIGGFGGVDGLAAYLRDNAIEALIDATHPFAAQISANAAEAARRTGVPILAFSRAPWAPVVGDRWIEVASLEDGARAIGAAPCRVLLTVGRLGLSAFAVAPQHDYLIRTIDDPGPLDELPRHRVILERGPFDAASETELMRREGVAVVVTKNSGGTATYGKIEAARAFRLPVVIVRPPMRPDVPLVHDLDRVMAFIADRAGGR